MIIKRLLLAQLALAISLGVVFLVPSHNRPQPAGVVLALPDRIGYDWRGQDVPVTANERQVLAADTGFARKVYRNSIGDQIYVGIVLSGEDMNNSIHRPERCLVAQGWGITESHRVPLPELGIAATQLHHSQPWPPTAPQFLRRELTYYWFIGTRDRTPSHFERAFIDMKDRILHGENQRWAYVTVEATITEGLRGPFPIRTEQETARLIEDFIPQIVPTFERREPMGLASAGPDQ